MKTYDVIIFDLDGTLLNTVSSMAKTVNEVLVHLGFSPRPEEEYKKYAEEYLNLQ